MKRFLFKFGFESPSERQSNAKWNRDFESSESVWVRAVSKDEALTKGRLYAECFVAKLYSEDKTSEQYSWAANDFAHWVCEHPEEEFPKEFLESLAEV